MKVGIAGAGSIIPDFLIAATKLSGFNICAICATERGRSRMEELAKEYDIPSIYVDYEQMVKSPKIDTIYVAVPNSMHYKFAKLALQEGKDVILEKPFASNYDEAKELVELAKVKGHYLFEAISNQYLPNYLKVKELLPSLGDIKIVELNFSQYSSRYDSFKQGNVLPVFDPKKSGGALMDLNVYNIHFVVGLFGEPCRVNYYANMEREIDTSGILVMQYPSFQCVAIGAKDCKARMCVNIQGDKGYIHSDSPTNSFEEFIHEMNSGKTEEFRLNKHEERLYDELHAFYHMVNRKDYRLNLEQMERSLCVMKILDEARGQVGIAIG
ncbi:MAG TPA: Gfo/Idh/MocA family oxidoreductase [Lachnospiraceae bacterium]|nr:Gfo/Idh/MocA family oxidoreductase [Lachnospiraceae bacterium]